MPAPAKTPSPTAPEPALRRLRWSAFGTQCEVQYGCADAARARAFETAAVAWVTDFEGKYSRFRPDSLVSRINREAGGKWIEIDAEMEQMLDVCGSVYRLSRGVLDVTTLPLLRLWDDKAEVPRIPSEAEIARARALVGWPKLQRWNECVRLPQAGMALDFGGWGKEFAVDQVAGLARRHGLTCALVNFGHAICAIGAAPGQPAWPLGLEDPSHPAAECWARLAAKDCAVATSGDYLCGIIVEGRRYGHIIDPNTGRPVANGCRQVTVIAPTCLQAGALSTAAFILGPEEGLELIQDMSGCEAAIVTDQARHETRGFAHFVVSN